VESDPTEDGAAVFTGIQLRAITKSFGAVKALKGVDFDVRAGEVVGLVGDNGAGKSTLTKLLSGALRPDSGAIKLDGADVEFANINDARDLGIEMLYQDLALCDDLDVAENFFVGREPTRCGLVRTRWMHRETRRHLERMDIRLPTTRMAIRFLSGGQRQSVAIARAVSRSPRILVLDEPTAALGVRQSGAVLRLINSLREEGMGVVFISHRMNDVLQVCDRIVVLFEGQKVAELEPEGLTVEEIVRYVVSDPATHAQAQMKGFE
jgi:simple sugar transport system ATP-binding protein